MLGALDFLVLHDQTEADHTNLTDFDKWAHDEQFKVQHL